MTFCDLETAMRAVCPSVSRDAAPAGERDYIVLSTYGLGGYHGDNRAELRVPRFQIDAYSQDAAATDPDGWFLPVLEALDELGLPYAVQDIGYDPDSASMRCIVQGDLI